MLYCPECGIVPIKESELPILLDSPVERPCPCGKNITCKREMDTMDTFVDSSWYFLRYCDPKNDKEIFDKKKVNEWMNVDVYIGGIEHAVLHLLYARFFHKFLNSLGLVESKEPFKKLLTQGIVQGKTFKNLTTNKYYKLDELEFSNGNYYCKKTKEKIDVVWEKMSKSKGNGVDPENVVKEFGSDIIRLYILFKAPIEKELEWDKDQIIGQQRFMSKFEKLLFELKEIKNFEEMETKTLDFELNQLIKNLNQDLENYSFNTCVASFHKYLNLLLDHDHLKNSKNYFEHSMRLLTLMYPFTPTFSQLHDPLVASKTYPKFDENIKSSIINYVFQVNGKKKGIITINENEKDEIERITRENPLFKRLNIENQIKKVIITPRVINFLI